MKPTLCHNARRRPRAAAEPVMFRRSAALSTVRVAFAVPFAVLFADSAACTAAAEPTQSNSLTVLNSSVHGPGDPLYIEGAVPEILLESSDGTRVTKIGSFDGDMVFNDLEPGRYTVRPAVRPWSGTCGHLDARAGECKAVVELPAIARLTVEHTVGRACAVRTNSRG